MQRNALVVAVVVFGACHHGATPNGSGSGSAVVIKVKKIQIAWGLSPAGANTQVFLQTTDETGSQVSRPLGSFPGACNVIDGKPTQSLTSVLCGAAGSGTQLDVVAQGDAVVVLRAHVDAGKPPDLMARDELMRFAAPPGAAIEAKPF
jgi:hypothetical protein